MLRKKKLYAFTRIFICLVLTILAGCAGVGGAGLGNNATSTDNTNTGNTSPTASLPLPYLINDNMISFSPDKSENVPVVGFAGAAEFSASPSMTAYLEATSLGDYRVAVSASVIEETVSCNEISPRPMGERVRERGGDLSLISNAYAADETTSICDLDSVSCCDLEDDGSFECYLPETNSSITEVYVAAVDSSGNVGQVLTDTIQPNLKWVKEAPTDVTVADGDIYTVTDGMGVKIEYDSTSETFSVDGEQGEGYKNFTASGDKLVYNENDDKNVIGVMNSTGGVCLHAKTAAGAGDCYATATQSNASSYTAVKYVDGAGYYGIKSKTSATTAYVYDMCDAVGSGCDRDGGQLQSSSFKFIDASDGLTYNETLAFDINNNKGVFVYKDGSDIKVRFADDQGNRFGGTTKISGKSTFDIKDIKLVSDSKALMLDSANNKVWVISIDENGETVTSTMNSNTNGISVGKGPNSLVLNSAKTRAYVLNETDETVKVINLKNSDGSVREEPEVVGTKNLKDVIGGKTVALQPKAMILDGDQLVIAANATKSLLLLDKGDIDESSLADEDNDGDGYTGAEGDCDDSNASKHPGLAETCGDSLDNDCDGTVDDGCGSDDDEDGFTAVADGGDDCDDTDANVNPDGSEVGNCFDGKDNDCDGLVDGLDGDCE